MIVCFQTVTMLMLQGNIHTAIKTRLTGIFSAENLSQKFVSRC